MGSYIPATADERRAMLATLGLSSTDELFAAVPDSVRVRSLDLPEGMSEMEVARKVGGMAEKNVRFRSVFRGRRRVPSLHSRRS